MKRIHGLPAGRRSASSASIRVLMSSRIGRTASTLRAGFTAHLVRENRHSADYELLDLFRTVDVDRDFTLAASWTLVAGPGQPDQVVTAVVRDNITDAEEDARIAWLEEVVEANRNEDP